ncbi:hypothetical protein DL93DRAFT_2161407, partial [Clavulina sp. PMI_390]
MLAAPKTALHHRQSIACVCYYHTLPPPHTSCVIIPTGSTSISPSASKKISTQIDLAPLITALWYAMTLLPSSTRLAAASDFMRLLLVSPLSQTPTASWSIRINPPRSEPPPFAQENRKDQGKQSFVPAREYKKNREKSDFNNIQGLASSLSSSSGSSPLLLHLSGSEDGGTASTSAVAAGGDVLVPSSDPGPSTTSAFDL